MNDQKRLDNFTRRSFILLGGKLVLGTALIGRLVQLQVFESSKYQTLSDKNRIQTKFLIPERGLLLDRENQPIAFNRRMYSSFLQREGKNLDTQLNMLADILDLSADEIERIQKAILLKHRGDILVKDNLSWAELAKLQVQMPDIADLSIEKGQVRTYYHPEAFCHVTGYVARISEKDLNDDPDLINIEGLNVGKSGLEKVLNNPLIGEVGTTEQEVNARRHVVRTIKISPAVSGTDQKLNLHRALQDDVFEILSQHRSAIAAVADTKTGQLLTFVSSPGFNTDDFVLGISSKKWKELHDNPDHPLINKLIAGRYAPGSTFKMVVALAALESGVISAHQTIHCPGHMNLGNHRFHCWTWKTGGHGHMDVVQAIVRSCDVYFYNIILKVGYKPIAEMAKKLGWGQPTGIELTGEALCPFPNNGGKPFSRGNLINLSIGQGALLATPIQLLRMTTALASGQLFDMTLTQSAMRSGEKIDVNQANMDLVRKAMYQVVNAGGTAPRANTNIKDFLIAGKTGSTQVSRITMKQRQDGSYKDLPYHLRDHAFFVGYAPYDDPRYAIISLVEHGKSGGRVAAPLAKDILLATRKHIEGIS